MILRRIKVIYAAFLFAALETIVVFIGVQDQTAHFAHLGGLVSGIILAAILLRDKGIQQKRPGETIYYDSYASQKLREIDIATLKKLAQTPEQQELLKRIETETIPQVRDTWVEHFLEKTSCPKCGSPLQSFDRKIWCKHCGFKTKY